MNIVIIGVVFGSGSLACLNARLLRAKVRLKWSKYRAIFLVHQFNYTFENRLNSAKSSNPLWLIRFQSH
jgi:hypothetical protein